MFAVPKVPVRFKAPPALPVNEANVRSALPVPDMSIVLPPWSTVRAPAVSVVPFVTKLKVAPCSLTPKPVRRLLVLVVLLSSRRVAPPVTVEIALEPKAIVAVLLRTTVPR